MKINLNGICAIIDNENVNTIDERNERCNLSFKFPRGSDEYRNYETYYANDNTLGF